MGSLPFLGIWGVSQWVQDLSLSAFFKSSSKLKKKKIQVQKDWFTPQVSTRAGLAREVRVPRPLLPEQLGEVSHAVV